MLAWMLSYSASHSNTTSVGCRIGKGPTQDPGRKTAAHPSRADAKRKPARAAHPVLKLQATAGNAATSYLMRQVAPFPLFGPMIGGVPIGVPDMYSMTADLYHFGASAAPTPQLPPDVAARLIAVRTTLSKVPRLEEKPRSILYKAIPGAPVLGLIKQRDAARAWLENMTAQISQLSPPGGQPDEATAERIYSLGMGSESKRLELEDTQRKIDALVADAGVGSEAELADLIENKFPAMFVERGKQVALQQLAENLKIIEAEAARFGVTDDPEYGHPGSLTKSEDPSPYQPGQPNPQAAAGLRAAANELIGYRTKREAVEAANPPRQMTMEDEYNEIQAGNPDPGGRMAIQAAVMEEQAALDRLALQFPILYRVNLDSVAKASDEALSKNVFNIVTELFHDIRATEENIKDGDLEIWNLRGIVDLTMLDLGIEPDSPLVGAIEAHIREAEADESILKIALIALQITGALIATFASGGVALVAGGVALGIGAGQVAGSVQDYMMESAASNVALDPTVADISINEPAIMPIVVGVLGMALDAAVVTKAILALREPARSLLASGDLAEFSAAAYRALPPAEAEQLILRASSIPAVAASAARGTAPAGTAWTVQQIQELFTRALKMPGPPRGSIVIHHSQASFDAAAKLSNVPKGEATLGFWKPAALAEQEGPDVVAAMGTLHLPPTATTLTVMHESLHMMGRQSGTVAIVGRYVEEGLTEWIARGAFGPEATRLVYESNVAFVRRLTSVPGVTPEVLRNAYLHRIWAPFRAALRDQLGGDAAVNQFLNLLKKVGANGEDPAALRRATDMLWPMHGR